jgi:hypothetical protein
VILAFFVFGPALPLVGFFFDLRNRNFLMKHLIAAAVVATLLAACASNQSKSSSDLADASSGTKTKKVCETVRTNETGARLRRVCKTVVVDESGDPDKGDES